MPAKNLILLPAIFLSCATPTLAQAFKTAGVISIEGGLAQNHNLHSGSYWNDTWSKTQRLGIDGRLGINITDTVTMQLDAWAVHTRNRMSGSDTDGAVGYDWQNTNFGGTVHTTVHLNDFYVGGAVGVGGYNYTAWMATGDVHDDHLYGTVALEAGVLGEGYRIDGQLGYTDSLYQNRFDDKLKTVFGGLAATYYFAPNLSASGAVVGVLQETGRKAALLTFEGRYRPEASPVILSLALAAQFDNSSLDGDTYRGAGQAISFGLKLPFGSEQSSLQDLDRSVGLSLYQPYYGRTAAW